MIITSDYNVKFVGKLTPPVVDQASYSQIYCRRGLDQPACVRAFPVRQLVFWDVLPPRVGSSWRSRGARRHRSQRKIMSPLKPRLCRNAGATAHQAGKKACHLSAQEPHTPWHDRYVGVLTDRSFAHPVQRRQVELFSDHCRHEHHGRALNRFGDHRRLRPPSPPIAQ